SREERERGKEPLNIHNGFDDHLPSYSLPNQNGEAWGQHGKTHFFEKRNGIESSGDRTFQPPPGVLRHNSHGDSSQGSKSTDSRHKEQATKSLDLVDATNGNRVPQHNGNHG